MNKSDIAKHIERLKHWDHHVRLRAAEALEKIGVPAIPALTQALKDEHYYVRYHAAEALGQIGDASVIPALIEALKDRDYYVRYQAALALGQIGDSTTLPRKILSCFRFSAQERIEVLEDLGKIRYKDRSITLRYTFPETRTLCGTVLAENDAETRAGAQQVLNWLNGDRELLRPVQPDTTPESQVLLRPAQGGTPESRPETLLRAASRPEEGD